MIDLHFESAAEDFLEKLRKSQPKHYRQIQQRLDMLRRLVNPPGKAKFRMKGGGECWRIPSADYRIVYEDYDDGSRRIIGIGKRNDGVVYLQAGRIS